jgi:hypothetical protein
MAWCTTNDVSTYTGINVGQENVEAAQSIIEIFADTTEEASDNGNISSTNLNLLKKAVAYQAAWMTQRPDIFTNMDVSSMNLDGLSVTTGHANSAILAPLAKRCIARLSWKRAKGIRVLPRRTRPVWVDREYDQYDGIGPWEAL